MATDFILPNWPVKPNIKSISTTRLGGVSKNLFRSLNLATHVGDDPAHVAKNREYLKRFAGLPAGPVWLQQVHGTHIVNAGTASPGTTADGSITKEPNVVCAVMTADCLPLLLTTDKGDRVCALHAGWRGLAAGIIEKSIDEMSTDPDKVIVWMGPAIGPEHFEVGNDVFQEFETKYSGVLKAFKAVGNEKWLMNIYETARQILEMSGVYRIYGGEYCTYSDKDRFYSYRRDNVCGRMASLIWMDI